MIEFLHSHIVLILFVASGVIVAGGGGLVAYMLVRRSRGAGKPHTRGVDRHAEGARPEGARATRPNLLGLGRQGAKQSLAQRPRVLKAVFETARAGQTVPDSSGRPS